MMHNDAMMTAMTGLPSGRKRPTRRGGGRHKGKPKSHADHHADVNAAMAKGDHQAAKLSALALAKALHARTKGAVSGPAGPSDAAVAAL